MTPLAPIPPLTVTCIILLFASVIRIDFLIPQDEKAFKQGANNGKPLVQTDARGKASKAIHAIAAKLGKIKKPAAEKQVKKSWSQMFKKG